MNNRIGFFAGAFDPIHDGHVEVAKSALKYLELDEVFFMVEEKPWGNKSPASYAHREAMVNLALKNESKINQLEISDSQFTIDKTLKEIEQKFPEKEIYFIFGADVFMKMNSEQWPQLDKLLKHYIVVFERANIKESEISNYANELGIAITILPSPHPNHSSTDVRMKQHNKSLWISNKVADYIDDNNIYSDSDSTSE